MIHNVVQYITVSITPSITCIVLYHKNSTLHLKADTVKAFEYIFLRKDMYICTYIYHFGPWKLCGILSVLCIIYEYKTKKGTFTQ